MRPLAWLTSLVYLAFVLVPPSVAASLHTLPPSSASAIPSPLPTEVTTTFVYDGDGGKPVADPGIRESGDT